MKFTKIFADFPWKYKVWDRDTGLGRSAEAHYATQGQDYNKGVDIMSVAADNCVLLMWATSPTLPYAFELVEHWNSQVKLQKEKFHFKNIVFDWAKLNKRYAKKVQNGMSIEDFNKLFAFGMGYYTRANPEPVLMFMRGHVKRLRRDVRQLIVAPIGAHSEKPDEAYRRADLLFPGPNLELFGRKLRENWMVLGQEVTHHDMYDDIAWAASLPQNG